MYENNPGHLIWAKLYIQQATRAALPSRTRACAILVLNYLVKRRRYHLLFNFVKKCTNLCIARGRDRREEKGGGEFRRCWQIKISHGEMTRASAEGMGLPQTWGGWCRSSLDCIVIKQGHIHQFQQDSRQGTPSPTLLRFPTAYRSFTCAVKSTRVRHMVFVFKRGTRRSVQFPPPDKKTKHSAAPGSNPGPPLRQKLHYVCQGENPSTTSPFAACI